VGYTNGTNGSTNIVGKYASTTKCYQGISNAESSFTYEVVQTAGTYNETYDNWAYNQSEATADMWNDTWVQTYNETYDDYAYNQSSTYNATYDKLLDFDVLKIFPNDIKIPFLKLGESYDFK